MTTQEGKGWPPSERLGEREREREAAISPAVQMRPQCVLTRLVSLLLRWRTPVACECPLVPWHVPVAWARTNVTVAAARPIVCRCVSVIMA